MPGEVQNRIVGIIGRKGTGKSTRLAERLQGEDHVFIWDPMAEHDWSPNELASFGDAADFFRWNQKHKYWAANYVATGDLAAEFEEICPLLYDRGNMTLAVDEVPLICKANFLAPNFGKLIRTGRHRAIDILWTAQRASEVSRTLTSLTDEFVLFSQTEPRDLDAISARCGVPVAERVSQLGQHDYIVWDVIHRKLSEGWPILPETFASA